MSSAMLIQGVLTKMLESIFCGIRFPCEAADCSVLTASSNIARMKKKSAKRRSAKRRPAAKARKVQKKDSAALKRAASKKTRSALKKSVAPATVAEYVARVPEPARSALNQIRAAIRSVVPAESTEVLSYKIPAFRHKKILVWYAAFTDHCSLFPTAAVIEEFKDDLKGFSTSKGTIHFPLDKPMPVELIKKMVEARVAQNESKPQ